MIYKINAPPKIIDYLYECNKENARVWNECIKLNNELWRKENTQINQKYLQDHIKGNFSKVLTAKCMQVTCKKYMSMVMSANRARKQGRIDQRHPWKYKKNFNTIWDIAQLKIDYKENAIRIPRPKTYDYKNINGKVRKNPIYLKFKKRLPFNITQIELIYNRGLKLSINYWIDEENLQIDSDNICAIDFGEIHSITTVDTNGNPEIITGRKIRSIQRFRNKELGELNRRLRRCKKGSRNYKKYRKAISKLLSKTNNKMLDSVNRTAKLFTDYTITNNINTVVIGDLSKFNMNLSKKKGGNQQKLVQWTHGKILNEIKYNLERYGIKIVEISEAYTSQTCPNCQNKYKPLGRNYICPSCGYTQHRDLVGAINILSKYINNGEIKPIEIHIKPMKYLRI